MRQLYVRIVVEEPSIATAPSFTVAGLMARYGFASHAMLGSALIRMARRLGLSQTTRSEIGGEWRIKHLTPYGRVVG